MNLFLITLLNGLIFAICCYFVSRIILQKKETDIKKIVIAFIPFMIMYYCILCLLESIYAIFFSGIWAFLFIKIIFNENIFMSLFISSFIHTFKIVNKILILSFIDNQNLLLINTYKTLDWNAFFVNLFALTLLVFSVFLLRKPLRKLINYISNLVNRKQVLLLSIYLNFILILIYQHPDNLLSISVITDLLMIFVITYIGIFSILSEMKFESLSNYYQEIFEYAKANGELLTHYKMQVHENKNRLLMIKSMLNGSKKEVKTYIDELLKEIEENKNNCNYWLSELRYIPLAGVRNFINYKLRKLTEMGTKIEVFVSSELEKIDASVLSKKDYNQLTTVLGVILDNMIESISKTDEKLVSINIYIENNEVHAEFVNTYSDKINLDRLNEVGYTTKGEQHGVGLSLVAKIVKMNDRFECEPKLIDNFFVQSLTIKIMDKSNLQKMSKN